MKPMNYIAKLMLTSLGGVIAYLEPTLPYILVCTFAIFLDCLTAWMLSQRVKKIYPAKADGKFKSDYLGRIFITIIKAYTVIVLAFIINQIVFEGLPIKLPNIAAGAICFWQVWSMLENESSCNNAKWAKIAQRILVDKTERHFNIDLHELHEDDTKNSSN